MKGGIRSPRTAGGTWAYRIDLGLGLGERGNQKEVVAFRSREEAEAALGRGPGGPGWGPLSDGRTIP
jgi:hypothetical protein